MKIEPKSIKNEKIVQKIKFNAPAWGLVEFGGPLCERGAGPTCGCTCWVGRATAYSRAPPLACVRLGLRRGSNGLRARTEDRGDPTNKQPLRGFHWVPRLNRPDRCNVSDAAIHPGEHIHWKIAGSRTRRTRWAILPTTG